jgi:hypothetical protein
MQPSHLTVPLFNEHNMEDRLGATYRHYRRTCSQAARMQLFLGTELCL